MNPIQLETLLAVFDEGSFEGAAVRLGISPSAVSQRIKALESHTGRVLVRRASPAIPTEAGEVLAQAARRMALLQAETEQQLSEHLKRIPLAIAINADSLATWFQDVMVDLSALDKISLRLRIEDESYTVRLLRSGEVLGAITRESTPVAGCDVENLGTMRYYPCASPRLLSRYSINTRIDWVNMPILRYGPNDEIQERQLATRVSQEDLQRIQSSVHQIPSSESFLDAVRLGLGWGMLPELQADPLLRSGEVVRIDDYVDHVPLYWQRWRLESPILEILSKSVIAAARKNLWQH